MIQILLICFGIILLLVGWYFSRHTKELKIIFTKENEPNLKQFVVSLCLTGLIGIGCGIFWPTKLVALFFVAFVLFVSAFYSIRLARLMK